MVRCGTIQLLGVLQPRLRFGGFAQPGFTLWVRRDSVRRRVPPGVPAAVLLAAFAFLVVGGPVVAIDGPSTVIEQIHRDQLSPAIGKVQEVRGDLEERFSLSLGADYILVYQYGANGSGEDDAAGGVARIYGHWTPIRNDYTTGMLIAKVENRHRIGTPIAPQQLGGSNGYAGLTAITYSDAGFELTNLYWEQKIDVWGLAFKAGTVDPTDHTDVYSFLSPWTDFMNRTFSTNPTMAIPNQGLGVAMSWFVTDTIYLLGGLADANADPHNPTDGFETYFSDNEYFESLEIGWVGSYEKRYVDNVHLVAWRADRRRKAGIDEGWGIAGSLSHQFADRWNPFLRAGYADGAGVAVDRSVVAGLGYLTGRHDDLLAFGAGWSSAPSESTGAGRRDQFEIETYYRINVVPHVVFSPDVQLIVNPARDPGTDLLWILGFRLRIAI